MEPPRAEKALLEQGVALLAMVVEENRRRAEKAARRRRLAASSPAPECRFRSRREDAGSAPGGRRSAPPVFEGADAMFKTELDLELCGKERKKPDLKAPCLSFPARLLTCIREKCSGNGAIAYTRAGVSRQIYSRIIAWDDETADKKTVMKFCIGLQLDMADAERLMKSAGYAFSNTIPLDRAFTFAIENRIWNIGDVEEMLVRNGLPGLGLHY